MAIEVNEDELKQGVLALVISLTEVIQDALRSQGLQRMEGGSLSEEECERLGRALMDLDNTLEDIKTEHGLTEATKQVRDSLDRAVDDALDRLVNPECWVRKGRAGDEGAL